MYVLHTTNILSGCYVIDPIIIPSSLEAPLISYSLFPQLASIDATFFAFFILNHLLEWNSMVVCLTLFLMPLFFLAIGRNVAHTLLRTWYDILHYFQELHLKKGEFNLFIDLDKRLWIVWSPFHWGWSHLCE